MEPRYPGDVPLDWQSARNAISNPLAKTAAPTHRLAVQLENARGMAAGRAKKKWPFAAVGKAAVNNLDLAPGPVVGFAENNLDRLRIAGHGARSAQPRDADGRKVVLK
jgi:hypothetical protein